MTVGPCDIPPTSLLDRRLIESAYFRDAYRAPLGRPQAGVVDIFFGIFGHHPRWMNAILIIRNRAASFCGLEAPAAAEILNVQARESYAVGDTIGVWPIFAMAENELVVGRDNKHLDFRLSLLKVVDGERASVVVSTICTVNNTFGKLYLFFVVPFHKWGVQWLMSEAARAGRL